MSERELLVQTAAEVMASAVDAPFDEVLWSTCADLGFATLGVAEELDGAGGTFADAVAVVGVAARFAVAAPLAESLLATHALASVGVTPPNVNLTVAAASGRLECNADGDTMRVRGTLERVAWAAQMDVLVVVADDVPGTLVIDLADCHVEHEANLAGEPRDTVHVDVRAACAGGTGVWSEQRLVTTAAALRVVQIAGALATVRDLTVEYVRQREQFGRPISSFQVVQHELAVLSSLVASARVAAEYVAEAPADFVSVGACKAYVGRICGEATRIAHELHGAIGFTEEHPLHRFTRRVWSWRDEWGSDSRWAAELGECARQEGVWQVAARQAADRAMV